MVIVSGKTGETVGGREANAPTKLKLEVVVCGLDERADELTLSDEYEAVVILAEAAVETLECSAEFIVLAKPPKRRIQGWRSLNEPCLYTSKKSSASSIMSCA